MPKLAAMTPAPPDPRLVERFRSDLEALAEPAGAIGVAVSGGPDSLALLLLAAAAWPGRVQAATVDHGLRAEAAAEARQVAAICNSIGCPLSILEVAVPAGGEGVQGEARRARYEALSSWMTESGIGLLLTAHHADDQAETLLMRLLRGSGVAGLAGVRAIRPLRAQDGVPRVARPLLGWRRDELAAIVRAAGIDAADDPSNRDPAFDRVRIRGRLAESEWLDVDALARSAAALADAEEALEAAAGRCFEERVEAEGVALLLRPAGVPVELLRRVVLRCLRSIAPEAAPRGEQLGALLRRLGENETATLAGVKCSGGETFRFEPAPPRRES